MAAKTQNRAKKQTQRANDADKRKTQAVWTAEKRMKTKGKNNKARLAELTAELDMQMADVQNMYTVATPNRPGASESTTTSHATAPVGDLADALRGL